MQIRPLAPEDRAALGALLAPILNAGDTYAAPRDLSPDAALAWWTQSPKTVHVAVDAAGRILGSYYIRPNAEGNGDHICNCGYLSDPAARGRGVATALLAHSLDLARAAGYRGMQFNAVVSTNEGAIRLWSRAGFETLARVPGAFHHPVHGYVDTLIMFKPLQPEPDA